MGLYKSPWGILAGHEDHRLIYFAYCLQCVFILENSETNVWKDASLSEYWIFHDCVN